MLVLSRHPKQTIRIGDDIIVHVHKVSPSRVTLGVEAPKDVKVMRGENADERKWANWAGGGECTR